MRGAIEVHVVYHDHLGETPHRQIVPLDMIATINECPSNHGAAPFILRHLTDNKSVAVLLVKQMEAFTQTFTVETYEEVVAKAEAAGMHVQRASAEVGERLAQVDVTQKAPTEE